MVGVSRRGKIEQRLEEALDMGCRKEIIPAGDQGYALQRIVHNDGKVIAGGELFPCQHDIAQKLGLCDLKSTFAMRAMASFFENQLPAKK